MVSYLRARDELQPVSRDELLDRSRFGTALCSMCAPRTSSSTVTLSAALNVPTARLERRATGGSGDRRVLSRSLCILSFEAVALLRERGYQVRRLERTVSGLEDRRSADSLGLKCG